MFTPSPATSHRVSILQRNDNRWEWCRKKIQYFFSKKTEWKNGWKSSNNFCSMNSSFILGIIRCFLTSFMSCFSIIFFLMQFSFVLKVSVRCDFFFPFVPFFGSIEEPRRIWRTFFDERPSTNYYLFIKSFPIRGNRNTCIERRKLNKSYLEIFRLNADEFKWNSVPSWIHR